MVGAGEASQIGDRDEDTGTDASQPTLAVALTSKQPLTRLETAQTIKAAPEKEPQTEKARSPFGRKQGTTTAEEPREWDVSQWIE